MKNFLIVVGLIVGLFALIFLANEFEIFGVKFWSVRKENARREVFEQTQSYVEGKRQDLIRFHHQWMLANDDDKKIIESTVRMSFSSFDESKLEQPELYSFLKKCKYE